MKINLSSDEINLLVHRYLIENGYVHTAFTFTTEAGMSKNPFWLTHCDKLPPNALISFLQKAMLYIYIEYHTDDETGEEIRCDEPFSFLKRHECWFHADDNNANNNFSSCMYNMNVNTQTQNNNNTSPRMQPTQNNNKNNIIPNGNELFEEKIDHSSAFPFASFSFSSSSTSVIPRKVGRPPTKGGRGKKRQRTSRMSSMGGGGMSCEEEEDNGEVSGGGAVGGEKDDESIDSDTPNSLNLNTQIQAIHSNAYEEQEKNLSSYLIPLPPSLSSTSNFVYIGPPHFDLKEKKKVKNLFYLMENEFSADTGALSEWSPTDSNLIVTNFAVGSPCLYRVPSKITSIYCINFFKELHGPAYYGGNNNNSTESTDSANSSNNHNECDRFNNNNTNNNSNSLQLNSGSSAHWKTDGSLIATGYESGDVRIWNDEGELLANLHASDTSVICVAFSYTNGIHLAAASADGTVCVYFIQEHALAKHIKETTTRMIGEKVVQENNLTTIGGSEINNNNNNTCGTLTSGKKKSKKKNEREILDEDLSAGENDINDENNNESEGVTMKNYSINNSTIKKQEKVEELKHEKYNKQNLTNEAIDASITNNAIEEEEGIVIKKEESIQEAEDGISTDKITTITYSPNIDYSQGILSNMFTTTSVYTSNRNDNNTVVHSKVSVTKQLQFFSVHTYQHGGGVIDIDWKDDEVLASGSIDGSIIVCDLKRQKITTLSLQSESSKSESEKQRCEIAAVRWDGVGKRLSIVDSSSVVKIWKPHALEGESNMVELHGHLEPVIKAEWANKHSQNISTNCLITVSMDKQLIMWDADSAAILNSFTYEHPPTTLRMSRDGSKLAVGTYDNGLRIYSMPNMQLLHTFYDNMVIPHVTWNSDNSTIAYNIFNMGKTVILSTKI